jgi:hypothetical protein
MRGIVSEVLDSMDAVIGRVGVHVPEGPAKAVASRLPRKLSLPEGN